MKEQNRVQDMLEKILRRLRFSKKSSVSFSELEEETDLNALELEELIYALEEQGIRVEGVADCVEEKTGQDYRNKDLDLILLRRYYQEVGRFSLCTPEEEQELAKRIAEGDEDALNRLTNANFRLVIRIAKMYFDFGASRGVSRMDLIQAGNEGLVKAAKNFKPQGTKFSNYSVEWIKSEITKTLKNQTLMQSLDEDNEEGISLREKIEDENADSHEDLWEKRLQAESVRDVLQKLPVKEQQILKLFYGIEGDKHTDKEIAELMCEKLNHIKHMRDKGLRKFREEWITKIYEQHRK